MNPKIYLIGLWGLTYKELVRVFRIWPQTFLPSVITMVLYFMIFGKVIGERVGTMDGVSYILFITPGLIMSALITNSYANVVSSFYGARFNRSIEELLVSPMPNWLIILGYLSGGLGRSMIVGVLVTIVAYFFTPIHIHSWPLTILTAIFCSLLFSLLGLINAIFARKFDDTTIVTTFILQPLIYLGGVFYSINALPPFWRHVSLFNPVHYVIDAFRFSMLGISSESFIMCFGIIVGCVVVLYILALWLMKVRLPQ